MKCRRCKGHPPCPGCGRRMGQPGAEGQLGALFLTEITPGACLSFTSSE